MPPPPMSRFSQRRYCSTPRVVSALVPDSPKVLAHSCASSLQLDHSCSEPAVRHRRLSECLHDSRGPKMASRVPLSGRAPAEAGASNDRGHPRQRLVACSAMASDAGHWSLEQASPLHVRISAPPASRRLWPAHRAVGTRGLADFSRTTTSLAPPSRVCFGVVCWRL